MCRRSSRVRSRNLARCSEVYPCGRGLNNRESSTTAASAGSNLRGTAWVSAHQSRADPVSTPSEAGRLKGCWFMPPDAELIRERCRGWRTNDGGVVSGMRVAGREVGTQAFNPTCRVAIK